MDPVRTAAAEPIALGAHTMQLYEDERFLVGSVASFIAAGVGGDEIVVSIATRAHHDAIDDHARAVGSDLEVARARGSYIELDAAELLASITVDGAIGAKRFHELVGAVIGEATQRGRVRVFGELVALLWAEGRREEAIRVEQLWNELARRLPFSLLCGYPLHAFEQKADGPALARVCAQHSHVVPTETFTQLEGEQRRVREIVRLQHEAAALAGEREQRRKAEVSLRRRDDTLHALILASPLAIVLIEPDTTVQLWNPAAERLFGWAEAEVLGRPIPILPPDTLHEYEHVCEAAVRGESRTGVETQRLRKDGSRVPMLVSAAPLRDERGVVCSTVVLFEDISERSRVEAARARVHHELEMLSEVGRSLSAELDLQRLMQALTDAAVQLAGAGFGAFFYNHVDEQGGRYRLYTLSGAPREAFVRLGEPRCTKIFAPTFAAIGVVRLDDVTKDPRYGQSPPHHGMPVGHLPVRSYLAVPVVGRGSEVLGGLFLGHPEPGVFTEDAERIVVGLGAQAAIAIDNARRYEAERHARAEAEAGSRAKDEFLAMLGHELRNPLAAVANALVTAQLDPSRSERALVIARRCTDQLTRLVDDLLDVARITHGRIELQRRRVPFASIVRRAVDATRSLVEQHGHRLTVRTPPDDVLVNVDPTRIEQVVVNLITNAAKYTDRGGSITIVAEREGAEVVLRVCDDGIGIAPEMLARVFELFSQGQRALDRAQGGLGIGLTVVKRLVDLHGGRVDAHSDGPGRGAELRVWLPIVTAAPDMETHRPADEQASLRRHARVIVVEDNPDAAESLGMLLELLGHHVRITTNGPSALDLARASPPDMMLVDIGLPGMNGYELARLVRRDPLLAEVVLVALTGYGGQNDHDAALAAGFDHHVVKPIDAKQVGRLVTTLVHRDHAGGARSS
jgi:PAS domain S-box-containing protein